MLERTFLKAFRWSLARFTRVIFEVLPPSGEVIVGRDLELKAFECRLRSKTYGEHREEWRRTARSLEVLEGNEKQSRARKAAGEPRLR